MRTSLPVGTLGVPRIGPRGELTRALKSYRAGRSSAAGLLKAATNLRAANWARQKSIGITNIPSNDFSLFDHVLDVSVMVGAIPEAYGWRGGPPPLDVYFAMSRDAQVSRWFDTNYHYVTPQFVPGQIFSLSFNKVLVAFREAAAFGHKSRPVLLGPITYLLLGRSKEAPFDPITLLDGLLPVYLTILKQLAAAGATWIQIDEPCLVLDLDDAARLALVKAYTMFAREVPSLRIMLATYFGVLGQNLGTALTLPIAGLHLDLVQAPAQLDIVPARAPKELVLSLGVIDGRNVWRADLPAILDRLEPVFGRHGLDRFEIAPSCSLLHVPVDLALENALEPDLKSWLAFSVQKMEELSTLGRALAQGRNAVKDELASSSAAVRERRASPKIHSMIVAARLAALSPNMTARTPYLQRRNAQQKAVRLAPFSTTTIGSFPGTDETRKARDACVNGKMDRRAYRAFLRHKIEETIRWQERLGIDILVHGGYERSDKVEYFAERLGGFAISKHGWVQSYGSNCVRPPIIFGDVHRPAPITVEWSAYAQSLTLKPVKGMLTGPVTLLQRSFVLDDIGRAEVCRQIALALRDEAAELESAGIDVIQIDEPALLEALPLRPAEQPAFFTWAAECFRLASSGVEDTTRIHAHIRSWRIHDVNGIIRPLDADVTSVDTRSKNEWLEAARDYCCQNEIAAGVYDTRTPRVPQTHEIFDLLVKIESSFDPDRIWISPDGDLVDRTWDETVPALANMVNAVRRMRELLLTPQAAQ